MKALAEPLLAAHEGIEGSAWSRIAALVWHSALPRNAVDGVLLVAVFTLLIASKLLIVSLPLVMKHIINILAEDGDELTDASLLVAAYCAVSVGAEGCAQLQQAAWGRLFYQITQRVSLALFEHLHALSMRWHLNRKTGEVLAVINQGVGAVGNLLQISVFQIAGTLFELALTSAVLYRIGVVSISACVIGGAAVYTGYTIYITQLRTGQRREQNLVEKLAQDAAVGRRLDGTRR